MSEALSLPEKQKAIPVNPDERLQDNPDRTIEADKRLDVLSCVMAELQSSHNFVEGATVFGSTMHGQASETSDIDTCIFIDPDKFSNDYGLDLTPDTLSGLANEIDAQLHARVGIDRGHSSSSHKQGSDVYVFPINETIIADQLASFQAQYERRQEFQRGQEDFSDAWFESVDPSLESEAFATSYAQMEAARDAELGDEPDFPDLGRELSSLFHPSVGESVRIDELRAALLDQLDESEVSEDIWRSITTVVEMFEGDTHDNGSKLPQSVDGAKQAYALSA